jgi:hypothetical protein
MAGHGTGRSAASRRVLRRPASGRREPTGAQQVAGPPIVGALRGAGRHHHVALSVTGCGSARRCASASDAGATNGAKRSGWRSLVARHHRTPDGVLTRTRDPLGRCERGERLSAQQGRPLGPTLRRSNGGRRRCAVAAAGAAQTSAAASDVCDVCIPSCGEELLQRPTGRGLEESTRPNDDVVFSVATTPDGRDW